MHRAFIDLLLAGIVSASCLLEYWGTRLLTTLSNAKQNRVALVAVAVSVMGLAILPTNFVFTNAFVLAVGLFAGMFFGRRIGSMGALVAFLSAAALADIISTHSGPTRWMVNQAQHPHHGIVLLQFLAICFRWKGELVGVVGVGDLFFFTVCVDVMRRLGRPEAAVLLVPLLGILSALALGLFIGVTPAIPFLAAAVILYTYVSSSLQREPCHS
jgi:hypothetical protein